MDAESSLARTPRAAQGGIVEPARDTNDTRSVRASPATEGSSARAGGRKAVVAAIEALLIAKRAPEAQRNAVLAAATEQLAQRTRSGQTHKVKVYDPAAQPQRPAVVPGPEMARARERVAPMHAR